MKKILISAYACSPYKGSEPGVGWGFVKVLSQYHKLWVITELSFQNDIELYFNEYSESRRNIQFRYIPRIRNKLLERCWPPAYYWTYREWHKEAFNLARSLHKEVKFDIAHQLTMVGFREPGYLWQLSIPFVWGPIGGMGYFPWRFLPVVGGKGACYYFGYNLMNFIHSHFLKRPKRAAKAAGNGLIAMNQENQARMHQYYRMPSEVCVPVGPPEMAAEKVGVRYGYEPLRIVWVGLLIHGKALNLALDALSLLSPEIVWELHVLGSGVLKEKWEGYAKKIGLARRCKFYGQVTRDEVIKVMSRSHVHLLTSLREGTPTVIIEASSFALPTVCLDCSGMSDMVNGSCGIKVPVTTPTEVVKGIAAAIERLAGDEELRQRLAKGALIRARDFSWERKAEEVNRIYAARIREAAADCASHEE